MTGPSIPLDTIKFALAAEETVVNPTVKIVAHIAGMVPQERVESNLRSSITEMMNRFIKADWQFAGMTGTADASGWERVTLIASARVPESENRGLEKRRLSASRPDEALSISRVETDLSSPARMIAETETRLRVKIIEAAREECAAISQAAGRDYRIHRIHYDTADLPQYANQRMSASGSTSKTSYGGGYTQDDAVIGNAQKLAMTAEITLAA